MKKITPLSLFIINQVRLKRLVQGVSARYLSLLLSHAEAYVSNIESPSNENQYPTHEWPKLAEALNCTVHDLLPQDQSNSTGELVDKIVLSLNNRQDLQMVIEGLIANGFFDVLKTKTELAKYLFIEKTDQVSTLETTLASLLKDGKLKQGKEGFLASGV